MDIGNAMGLIKEGRKVGRKAWGKNNVFASSSNDRTWIVLMPELKLPAYSAQIAGAKVNDRTAKHIGHDTPLNSQPYIALWVGDGRWQPGWIPTQEDLLAMDYFIVD
jgi:hypothetical protein